MGVTRLSGRARKVTIVNYCDKIDRIVGATGNHSCGRAKYNDNKWVSFRSFLAVAKMGICLTRGHTRVVHRCFGTVADPFVNRTILALVPFGFPTPSLTVSSTL